MTEEMSAASPLLTRVVVSVVSTLTAGFILGGIAIKFEIAELKTEVRVVVATTGEALKSLAEMEKVRKEVEDERRRQIDYSIDRLEQNVYSLTEKLTELARKK